MKEQEVNSELNLFVLWSRARIKEKEILEDIAKNFQIVAQVEAQWPEGVDAESGYRRFYGIMLPERIRKSNDSGEGPFLIVIVRDLNPEYGLSDAKRGLENASRHMFEGKWRYRELFGRLHCVHGTNSQTEARRDIMMLTGQSMDSWVKGSASPSRMNPLPGQLGWKSLEEVFSLLEETHVYAILPNALGRCETATGAVGDEMELLVGSAEECRYLLNARREDSLGTVYHVMVSGRDMRFRFRVLGEGFIDEGWGRELLRTRRRAACGCYLLAPEEAFYVSVYRAAFLDRELYWQVVESLKEQAGVLGIEGGSLSDFELALEAFMGRRLYRYTRSKDGDLLFNEALLAWRQHAAEFTSICGGAVSAPYFVTGHRRTKDDFHEVQLRCEFNGHPAIVDYVGRPGWLGEDVRHEFKALKDLSTEVPESTVLPEYWHFGRVAAYLVEEAEEGMTLRSFIDRGGTDLEEKAGRVARGLVGLAEGLRKAGLIHRGLTPDVVLVRRDGSVYISEGVSMERRRKYRKESFRLRNDFDGLSTLGEEGGVRTGVWNDAHALLHCAELLPRGPEVETAISQLRQMAQDAQWTLHVHLPKSTVFKLFGLCLREARSIGERVRRRHRALLFSCLWGAK